jgi:hypothetical protein
MRVTDLREKRDDVPFVNIELTEREARVLTALVGSICGRGNNVGISGIEDSLKKWNARDPRVVTDKLHDLLSAIIDP